MTTDATVLSVLLACCLCSAGCVGLPTGPPSADVALTNVSENVSDGPYEFRADLTVEGNYESIELESVSVQFLDDEGGLIRQLDLGDLKNRYRNGTSYSPRVATVDVTLPQRPAAITIRTGTIRSEARVAIYGLRRNASGDLVYVDQE